MKISRSRLKDIIMEEVSATLEGHYHDMGDDIYNVLDPHGFESMSDSELIDMMHQDGLEKSIVLNGEGGLANREEAIATLKDV